MSSSVAISSNETNEPQGHCSRCHRIWKLKERQGVCPWCHKPASCITATSKPRPMKSRSRRRKRQEISGTGYDQLTGEYLVYYQIASRFTGRVRDQDCEDVLHEIIITLAEVEHKATETITEAAMHRIASRTVALYWRRYYRHRNGLTCGNCSTYQRQTCREQLLYGKCPKAVSLESLDKPVIDGEGNMTDLGNIIADDTALDLEAWTDARTFLLNCPDRLVSIAFKRMEGTPLEPKDQEYLRRFRMREQKSMFNRVFSAPIRN